MKVFISWSGERSRQTGELLDEWLKCVLQAINPWRSDRDIDRGSLWFTQITNQLQETSIGIVCITQENKNNPWILFESGALAKGLSTNRVCTFLIDLKPGDIKDPLAQFNHTTPDMAGVKSLVRTLNSTLEEKSLPDKILDEVFDTYWPKFKEKFDAIIKGTPEQEKVEVRSENDILSEILDRTRAMDRRLNVVERANLNSKHNFVLSDDESTKPHMSPNAVRKRVQGLLEYGMEPNEIINSILSNHYAPIGLIRSTIEEQMNERNNIESHI